MTAKWYDGYWTDHLKAMKAAGIEPIVAKAPLQLLRHDADLFARPSAFNDMLEDGEWSDRFVSGGEVGI